MKTLIHRSLSNEQVHHEILPFRLAPVGIPSFYVRSFLDGVLTEATIVFSKRSLAEWLDSFEASVRFPIAPRIVAEL